MTMMTMIKDQKFTRNENRLSMRSYRAFFLSQLAPLTTGVTFATFDVTAAITDIVTATSDVIVTFLMLLLPLLTSPLPLLTDAVTATTSAAAIVAAEITAAISYSRGK